MQANQDEQDTLQITTTIHVDEVGVGFQDACSLPIEISFGW